MVVNCIARAELETQYGDSVWRFSMLNRHKAAKARATDDRRPCALQTMVTQVQTTSVVTDAECKSCYYTIPHFVCNDLKFGLTICFNPFNKCISYSINVLNKMSYELFITSSY